jgi:DNA mismatch repair protein MutS
MSQPQGIVGEFLSLKRETEADLLAMQCGDFYEFFADDAELVADELDLKVSQKSSHGSSYPMAGVPVDDLTPYLKALVERGYRVAVADQFDDGDGGHERRVTRVVTPGTLLETSDADAQYLAAIVAGDDGGYGLALADVTTGQFLATAVASADRARSELYRFAPAEVLPGPALRADDEFLAAVREGTDATMTLHETEAFAPGRARRAVREQFGAGALESVGLAPGAGGRSVAGGEGDREAAVRAAGAVLAYVEETGAGVARSMTRLRTYRPSAHVELDATTQRNLELVETMHGDREGSLLATVDHTVTSPGRRLLREWLTRPRQDRQELRRRHDAVEALTGAALAREALQDALGDAYDLERLASRAASGSADARALVAVRGTLDLLPELSATVEDDPTLSDSPLAAVLGRPDREAAADLRETLAAALADDPPGTLTEGGLIRRGYDDDLDDLVERHEEAREWLDGLADRERRRHGLSHVTVDRNKTDGYYIQVGKSAADDVPDHYRHVKTLKNSKRFTTDELEERERDVLRLEEARGEMEYELFCEVREAVAEAAEVLQSVGRAIAEVDALASLATHAVANDWTRPTVTDGNVLEIEAGRHPVVERTTEFVPNDLRMGDDRRFLVVTGPNMSGKSTFMRQAALITLLAQAGSFVPARSATVGVVDGIYTRVGALDELAGGRSTFMVEMQELSNILHSATADSLVVLDEVGRGTATYDGISIAWAATEYLVNEVRANCLFATHYHELTGLADRLPGVHNVHMDADEEGGDVTFLRTVEDGPADRSYGVHVADLAGVPAPVVDRAADVLERLREEKAVDVRGGDGDGEPRQVVFDLGTGQFRQRAASDGGATEPAGSDTAAGRTGADSDRRRETGSASEPGDAPDEKAAVLEALREVDLDETPPVELMASVREWQRRLDDPDREGER